MVLWGKIRLLKTLGNETMVWLGCEDGGASFDLAALVVVVVVFVVVAPDDDDDDDDDDLRNGEV